jgi:DNA-binding transcriptional MerR regulator
MTEYLSIGYACEAIGCPECWIRDLEKTEGWPIAREQGRRAFSPAEVETLRILYACEQAGANRAALIRLMAIAAVASQPVHHADDVRLIDDQAALLSQMATCFCGDPGRFFTQAGMEERGALLRRQRALAAERSRLRPKAGASDRISDHQP